MKRTFITLLLVFALIAITTGCKDTTPLEPDTITNNYFSTNFIGPVGDGRYYVENNTVTDTIFGIQWILVLSRANITNAETWTNAMATVTNLTYAGHSDWFIPNTGEYESINTDYILVENNTANQWYWTRTYSQTIPNNANTVGWCSIYFAASGAYPTANTNRYVPMRYSN